MAWTSASFYGAAGLAMAEANPEKRYWDSSVFLARIKREPERKDICKAIIDDAKAGRCVLWTSMITLTEVVKPWKGPVRIGEEHEAEIAAFFRNEYVKLVPVDHPIATRARRLIWDFPWLSSRDAIHIATAIQIAVPVLEHYDDDYIGRVAERIKKDNLTGFPEIRHPQWTGQPSLPLDALPATESEMPSDPSDVAPADATPEKTTPPEQPS